MSDRTGDAPDEGVVELVERGDRDRAVDRLDAVRGAPTRDRKATLRSLRTLAEDRPSVVGEVVPSLAPFLADDERSVRLTAAKLFVAVAEGAPASVVPAVPTLVDRLADEDEFYYVRARSAEALGYIALERPEAVDDPAIVAEFRVGLSFEDPEVTEKLAKALACVALGEPERLRHQMGSLSEHLDDGNDLVRYHLATALAAVGCEYPGRLAAARDPLVERIDDGNEYVRGRAVEALGLLARADEDHPVPERVVGLDDEPSFVADRVAFATGERSAASGTDDAVGTIASIREGTDDVVAEMTAPDDGDCPRCGFALPEDGPPVCPQCGTPR